MLNEQQKQLVEENHNLIYGFAHRHNINLNEYYDVLAISLCKAGESFDDKKGKFSTYAYTIMWRDYLNEMEAKFTQKRNGLECEFTEETTQSKNNDLDTDILILDYLNEREKKVLLLRGKGYTIEEVGRILGIHKSYVSKILSKTREKLRKAGYSE
jgi:RNA polymerase sigma factor (sigma-70 family)